MAETISHPDLLRLLDYEPETGFFRWKISSYGKVQSGRVAGGLSLGGYWRISISGVEYLAHRLAWFYVHGQWPDGDLDHEDTNRRNNRIGNLRPTNKSLNAANKRLGTNNTSGAKGVRKRANNRWRASIEHNGRFYSLGTYGSREEASAAYLEGARKIFGEFARVA